jgi:hypothetical protein
MHMHSLLCKVKSYAFAMYGTKTLFILQKMKQIWKLMIVGNILKQVSILLALYPESIT